MYNIKLVLGDWSSDGHEITESFMIQSSIDRIALKKAYKEGSKIVGFNLSKEVCHIYEDNTISNVYLDKLISLGFDINQLGDCGSCEDANIPAQLDTIDFYMIFMFIAQLGNPELKYELIVSETMNIGGYGLFY